MSTEEDSMFFLANFQLDEEQKNEMETRARRKAAKALPSLSEDGKLRVLTDYVRSYFLPPLLPLLLIDEAELFGLVVPQWRVGGEVSESFGPRRCVRSFHIYLFRVTPSSHLGVLSEHILSAKAKAKLEQGEKSSKATDENMYEELRAKAELIAARFAVVFVVVVCGLMLRTKFDRQSQRYVHSGRLCRS